MSTVLYNILPELIYEYNNSFHRSIKMSPNDARKKSNFEKVYKNLYSNQNFNRKQSFKIGDKVRISLKKGSFSKEVNSAWSEELFVISDILHTSPITYIIKDLNNEIIQGSFYKEQLKRSDIYNSNRKSS